VVNLGRHLGVDAEMALRGCNLRFRSASGDGAGLARPLEELAPHELEALWAQAKKKLDESAESARPEGHDRDSRLRGSDELEACVQLQIETWGYDPKPTSFPARPFWWRRRSAAR
jgi:hypothetical protein